MLHTDYLMLDIECYILKTDSFIRMLDTDSRS